MAKNLELAWAAGFIDGEGCFFASQRPHLQMELKVSQIVREPLERLTEILGVGDIRDVSHHAHRIRHHHEIFLWGAAGGPQLRIAIPQLLPFLVLKREQAELLLALACDAGSGPRYGRRLTPAQRIWREEMVAQLKAAKRPGADPAVEVDLEYDQPVAAMSLF